MFKPIAALAALTVLSAFAGQLEYRYQDARTSRTQTFSQQVEFLTSFNHTSDQGIEKSLLAIQIAKSLKKAMKKFEAPCASMGGGHTTRCGTPPHRGGIVRCPGPRPAEPSQCSERNKKIAKNLRAELNNFKKQLSSLNGLIAPGQIKDSIILGEKLATNMEKPVVVRPMPRPGGPTRGGGGIGRGAGGGGSAGRAAGSRGLNVTAGGAQTIEAVRMQIQNGQVPKSENFVMEGFLSEFDLPLHQSQDCKQLLCLKTAQKFVMKDKKLYVQLDMGTNVTEANFKRRPLNLSIVLDISGSMSAQDNTEISRIDWAKRAIEQTVGKMGAKDMLSIVLFNSQSRVLLPPTAVVDRKAIISKIKSISAGGSTNMHEGLREGLQLVSRTFDSSRENRVILLSDAGLNTGVTDPSSLTQLVGDFASEGIGLTAMGIGLNFNQKLIHAITMGKGGNYIFVNSGEVMKKYFDQFKYLVSPIAYHFKGQLEVGVDAKLVATYGIPKKEGHGVAELFDIRTLFFASEGGGAIVLEYDLQ